MTDYKKGLAMLFKQFKENSSLLAKINKTGTVARLSVLTSIWLLLDNYNRHRKHTVQVNKMFDFRG